MRILIFANFGKHENVSSFLLGSHRDVECAQRAHGQCKTINLFLACFAAAVAAFAVDIVSGKNEYHSMRYKYSKNQHEKPKQKQTRMNEKNQCKIMNMDKL